MSVADEVRRWHRRETGDEGSCGYCWDQAWPCVAIRLADVADDLLAACEAALEFGLVHLGWCPATLPKSSSNHGECTCGTNDTYERIETAIERAKQ